MRGHARQQMRHSQVYHPAQICIATNAFVRQGSCIPPLQTPAKTAAPRRETTMTSLKPWVLSTALLLPITGCQALDTNDTNVAEGAITGTATRPLLTSTEAAGF